MSVPAIGLVAWWAHGVSRSLWLLAQLKELAGKELTPSELALRDLYRAAHSTQAGIGYRVQEYCEQAVLELCQDRDDYRVPLTKQAYGRDAHARIVMDKRIQDRTPDGLARALSIATPGQRAIYTCFWHGAMVASGGHELYFRMHWSTAWKQAVEGYALLGAEDRAKILRGAALAFGPNGPPADPGDREELLDEILERDEAEFSECDRRWYAIEWAPSNNDLMEAYVDAHPQEFFF